MEYRIDGVIEFSSETSFKLYSAVDFASPLGIHTTLNFMSYEDKDLSVSITLEAENYTAAEKLAERELSRICNLLRLLYNISILETRITAIAVKSVTPYGNDYVYLALTAEAVAVVRIKDFSGVYVGLHSKEQLNKLVSDMERDYAPEFDEVISMWIEAINQKTEEMRYILLYRVMERLFSNDTKKLTEWIMSKEPSVQIVHDRQRGDVTIYTWLRDNIHPKQKAFPLKQMRDNLPKFQTLVHEAIREKYNIK